MPSPAGKWNQHLHKACQQKEAWSAQIFPGRWLRWLWTSENTGDQNQQMAWQPKSSFCYYVPLHPSSRLWDLDFQIKLKCTFIWKEDFGPLSNSPVLFLLSPGKIAFEVSVSEVAWYPFSWRCLSVETPADALTAASVHSFFKALPSVWIIFAWQYSQDCGHPCCLCTFSYPISSFQSTLHLICFDTALLEQPPLSPMTLCDLPSFGWCQWSSSGPLPSHKCCPLLWFQRTHNL